MHIICLTPVAEGVYRDHYKNGINTPPEGWAYIPADFKLPPTFPRLGSLEVEEKTYSREVKRRQRTTDNRTEMVVKLEEYKMLTVVSMTEGVPPEPKPEKPTQLDTIEAQVTYTALMTDTLLEV